jgi:hypothetical protein
MLKRIALTLVGVLAFGTVSVAAAGIPQRGTTTIVPNNLTVSWADKSNAPVTIDTFRIFGYNVAQLRTRVSVLGGTVSNLQDGTRLEPLASSKLM